MTLADRIDIGVQDPRHRPCRFGKVSYTALPGRTWHPARAMWSGISVAAFVRNDLPICWKEQARGFGERRGGRRSPIRSKQVLERM
jgi:hypothetical protein